MIRIDAEKLEKSLQRLSAYLCLLKDRPTEHIEAVWRENVVFVLEELCAVARVTDAEIFNSKKKKLLEDIKRLPEEIKKFVEGD